MGEILMFIFVICFLLNRQQKNENGDEKKSNLIDRGRNESLKHHTYISYHHIDENSQRKSL